MSIVAAATCACTALGLLDATHQDAYAQQTIQVMLTDGRIEPGMLTATQNTSVSIEVVNAGTKIHNLVIPDFYIFTQNLTPGQKVIVTFSPDKTGTFPYYSDAGGIPESGMRGQLKVN